MRRCMLLLVMLVVALAGASDALGGGAGPTLVQPSTGATVRATTAGFSCVLAAGAVAPDSGSAKLTFTPPSPGVPISLDLSSAGLTACLNGTLSVDLTNPAVASPTMITAGSSVPDGVYSVVFSYRLSAVAQYSAAVANITIDSITTAPTLNSPTAGSYNHTLPISFSLPESGSAGTLTLAGAIGTRTLQLVGSCLTAGSHSTTLSLANPTDTPCYTATGSGALTDGSYTVALAYQDLVGNPLSSTVRGGVIVDTATLAPTITAPVTGTTLSHTGAISYSLPETPAPGSVTISFVGTTTYTLTLSGITQGATTTTINLDAPSASANVTGATPSGAIADGTYTIRVDYQDSLYNPTSGSTVTSVLVDRTTLAPTITSPLAGGTLTRSAAITFNLPEGPLTGSVTITFVGLSIYTVTLSGGSQGVTTTTLNLDNPTLGTGVITSTPSGAIPDGTYTVRVSYGDVHGNPTNSASVTGVVIATVTRSADGGAAPADVPGFPLITSAPRNVAILRPRWATAPHRIATQIALYANATSYRLTATKGTRVKAGTCTIAGMGAQRKVRCSLKLPRGAWSTTLQALGGDGAVLAQSAPRTSR